MNVMTSNYSCISVTWENAFLLSDKPDRVKEATMQQLQYKMYVI